MRKDQIGGYKKLKSRLKHWERSWLKHQMKFIGEKLKENQLRKKRRFCQIWKMGDQQLNKNEELTCVTENPLDRLRCCDIKMKPIKIKHARIHNQEEWEMFYW